MKFRWLWLLLLLPIGLGLARLRLDTEVLNLLPEDLPEVQGLKRWQEHFQGAGDLLVTLRTGDPDESARLAGSLATALRAEPGLANEVHWQAPWREHRGDSAELIAAMWLNQSPAEVERLRVRLDPQRLGTRLTQLREQLAVSLSPDELARLSYDPLGLLDLPGADTTPFAQGDGDGPPFASADGTFRIVHVQPPALSGGYQASIDWLRLAGRRLGRWRAETEGADQVELGMTGGPAFVADISTSMERDMKWSISGTALILVVLFGLAHRRLRPLLWLITLLAVSLLLTMAAGGLLYGRLNVVSLGFAAILLGLGVDYALVLYQERLAHPRVPLADIRRWTASGIGWSAVTTAGAFALLNFGGLPGLAQLGTLVAVGVAVSAAVMIAWFLPPLEDSAPTANPGQEPIATTARSQSSMLLPGLSVLLGGVALGWALHRPPGVDASAAPLRPLNSPAYSAMAELRREIGGDEAWPLLVSGADEQQVADALIRLREHLTELSGAGVVESFTLPDSLWPNPRNQAANRPALLDLLGRQTNVLDAARAAGFTTNSFALADAVFATWRKALAAGDHFVPGNEVSRWIARQSVARDGERWIAACTIQPTATGTKGEWLDRVQGKEVLVAGWDRLGPAIFSRVEGRLHWLLAAIVVAQLLALWMAFGRVSEVLLSALTLAFGGALLLAVMSLANWSWNLMNLMAVPLLLGATEDYSIHMQHSLRRNRGDGAATFRATGKAVLLCAATTAAGFGSLAFSTNAGLASLGQVCAVGVLCAAFASCGFLPAWWRLLHPKLDTATPRAEASQPSRLYGSFAWRLGMAGVRALPLGFGRRLGSMLALGYGLVAGKRRRIVEQNLLPVLNGDAGAARRAAWRLFRNFGVKVADLLRYESGLDVENLFRELPPRDRFVLPAGRGVLLLTIHLGNWEFGAPLLRRLGINLLVITLAEPGRGFTELREQARKRWGVETLVIGQDAFAFVEVLKRLQAGAAIALLVDRPPAGSGVDVELFDQQFTASISAAELARASGCALLPVAVPWTPTGYEVVTLPEITYDRARLGDRTARRALTQEILRAFAPVIRQHPDQWFHFVPIWPRG